MKINKEDDKKMEIHKKKRLDVYLKGKKGMPMSQGIAGTAVLAELKEVDGGEEIFASVFDELCVNLLH